VLTQYAETTLNRVQKPSGKDRSDSLLLDLRPVGVVYGRCILTQPWAVEMESEAAARLHLVAAGHAFFCGPDGCWVQLQAGDLVWLPQGAGHVLADDPHRIPQRLADLPRQQIADRTYELEAGGGGAATVMLCCSIQFEQPALHPLLACMPAAIIRRKATAEDPLLSPLLEAMADEVSIRRLGSVTMLTRLADVVVTRLVRIWIETAQIDAAGWLQAMLDPQLGRALAAIHREPGFDWTVERLADKAGLSRSVLSDRFSSVVGVSPARYLARWRVRVAHTLLAKDGLSVAETAYQLGYGSEAAFGRAFKRVTGRSPGLLRRSSSSGLAR
jgi:AraC-like DNA-binding protein